MIMRYFHPSWFGLVDEESAWRLKGPRFDSHQGHIPWLHFNFKNEIIL